MTPLFTQTSTQPGSGLSSLLLLVLMVGVFWAFVIRPQRSRMRQQQTLQRSLELGDEVQTIGGIIGTVREIEEHTVVLEVESGLIRFAKRAISGKVSGS